MSGIGDMSGRVDHRTFDALLELKDAGLVGSSAAAQVDSSDKVVDLGSATGFVEGIIRIDVTACEVASGDEKYIIGVQFCDDVDFTDTIVEGPSLMCGDATQLPGDIDVGVGQYNLAFRNEFDGTVYRYMRLYTTVSGTVATGINYKAYIGKLSA